MASFYTQKSSNIRKTWVLMGAFFVAVIGIGWFVTQVFGNPIFLYVAVFFSITMNITSYWFSDKVVIASSGAKAADGEEWLELNRIVENLAITAGLPKPKVYVINDSAPNAFATGRDPEHSAIAVTTGLLDHLDRSELEGVLAHELSHIGNRDILIMTSAVVLVGFISILADIILRVGHLGTWNSDNNNRSSALLAVFSVIAFIIAPIAAQLMQFAISRRREFLADASGVLITRYPEGLASALEKISSYKDPMRRASHATAHLFISNPFGASDNGSFIGKLLSTHPPIPERLIALRDMKT